MGNKKFYHFYFKGLGFNNKTEEYFEDGMVYLKNCLGDNFVKFFDEKTCDTNKNNFVLTFCLKSMVRFYTSFEYEKNLKKTRNDSFYRKEEFLEFLYKFLLKFYDYMPTFNDFDEYFQFASRNVLCRFAFSKSFKKSLKNIDLDTLTIPQLIFIYEFIGNNNIVIKKKIDSSNYFDFLYEYLGKDLVDYLFSFSDVVPVSLYSIYSFLNENKNDEEVISYFKFILEEMKNTDKNRIDKVLDYVDRIFAELLVNGRDFIREGSHYFYSGVASHFYCNFVDFLIDLYNLDKNKFYSLASKKVDFFYLIFLYIFYNRKSRNIFEEEDYVFILYLDMFLENYHKLYESDNGEIVISYDEKFFETLEFLMYSVVVASFILKGFVKNKLDSSLYGAIKNKLGEFFVKFKNSELRPIFVKFVRNIFNCYKISGIITFFNFDRIVKKFSNSSIKEISLFYYTLHNISECIDKIELISACDMSWIVRPFFNNSIKKFLKSDDLDSFDSTIKKVVLVYLFVEKFLESDKTSMWLYKKGSAIIKKIMDGKICVTEELIESVFSDKGKSVCKLLNSLVGVK